MKYFVESIYKDFLIQKVVESKMNITQLLIL